MAAHRHTHTYSYMYVCIYTLAERHVAGGNRFCALLRCGPYLLVRLRVIYSHCGCNYFFFFLWNRIQQQAIKKLTSRSLYTLSQYRLTFNCYCAVNMSMYGSSLFAFFSARNFYVACAGYERLASVFDGMQFARHWLTRSKLA